MNTKQINAMAKAAAHVAQALRLIDSLPMDLQDAALEEVAKLVMDKRMGTHREGPLSAAEGEMLAAFKRVTGGPEKKLCAVCGLSQFDTPSGVTCANGHGGAPAKEASDGNA